jgi:hypothetical protein
MAIDTERSVTVALVRDQLRDSGVERHRVGGSLVEIRDVMIPMAGNSSGGGTFTSVTRFRYETNASARPSRTLTRISSVFSGSPGS